jgi:hypothetical protein
MGAVPWKSDVEYSFGTDAYNDEYVKLAYAEPHTPDKAWYVYGASKTQTERAIQKWVAENKPNFVYNAVLPALNIGDSVSGAFGSTGGWTKAAADGDFSLIQYVPPRTYLDQTQFGWFDALTRLQNTSSIPTTTRSCMSAPCCTLRSRTNASSGLQNRIAGTPSSPSCANCTLVRNLQTTCRVWARI